MSQRPVAVVSDANVLIDYLKVGRTKVLRLVADHLFEIMLPRSVLQEVDQLDQDRAESLGMTVVKDTLGQIRDAAARGCPLSKVDKLCFVMARDNNWAVWTSDKPLHTKCADEGILVYWGLQLMLDLVKAGKLSLDYALETAQKIEAINERISPAVLMEFERRIGKLKVSR
jgi:rRNA-processing protein FCF1